MSARMHQGGGGSSLMMAAMPPGSLLLPYQRRFIEDRSQLKIWLASRQAGKSFALALDAVIEAASARGLNVLLSASEHQSRELMLKVHAHLRALDRLSNGRLAPAMLLHAEARLKNGSRIIALAANASTARGFSGNVFLDEFAFHHDSREVWRALYPTITRGYKIRVSSTPNGRGNLFHDLWSASGEFSRHRTDIYEAVSEGLKVDIERLRAGLADADAWAQEYECRFLDESSAFLPLGLIAASESPDAQMDFGPASLALKSERYIGVDVGRVHDLTVFWILERSGDVLWTRGVRVMKGEKYSSQRDALYTLIEQTSARRIAMDATGMGGQLAEEAAERFGSRVERHTFTAMEKEDLALGLRRAFEERGLRIPSLPELRADLHSVRRSITTAGNVRIAAERGSGDGHADRFWALALAAHAARDFGSVISYESVSKTRTSPALRKGGI